jgi:hypothetical protein
MNPWVNVTKGVLTHPTVKVSIATHNDSIVSAFREQLPEIIEALLGSIRFPDRIIASAQKANIHSGESLHVFQSYQVSELGLVTADVVRRHCTHSRKMGQEVHVNAVK